MTKEIECYVSAVRYSSTRSRITRLQTHLATNINLNESQEKNYVVQSINNGHLWFTMYRTNGKWTRGAEIETILSNNEYFLRTKGNTKIEDNLGNLPEF